MSCPHTLGKSRFCNVPISKYSTNYININKIRILKYSFSHFQLKIHSDSSSPFRTAFSQNFTCLIKFEADYKEFTAQALKEASQI